MNNLFILFIICLLEVKIPEEQNNYKTLLVINLLRHGARTPNKIIPEFEQYFKEKKTGKLTQQGFRQMVLLGKATRNHYIDNKQNLDSLLDINKIHDQFVLFSSPYPRAIESGVAYLTGLFPEYDFEFINKRTNDIDQTLLPPSVVGIGDHAGQRLSNNMVRFIIEDDERDVLFHSRRCKFPEHIYKKDTKDKNYVYLTMEERDLVYNHFKQILPITFKDLQFTHFTDKLARSLFSGLQSVNFHNSNVFHLPDNIKAILQKLFVKYLFLTRTTNETITKITSTPFLQHLLNLFEHKVFQIDDKLDFHELSNFHYTDLRLVTYSGHDYNFIGLIKNLLDLDTIHHYIDNLEMYRKLLIIPYASSIEFHLIQNQRGYYFIKIYLNGEEVFEKLRSHEDGAHVMYNKEYGIPYSTFRKIIKSRIFIDIEHCIHTK
jgi:hypothetical protein